MSSKFFFQKQAYETDGTPHLFEATEQVERGSAPYVINLDGEFLATAESLHEIGEEIVDVLEKHRWSLVNPIFA